MAEIPLEEDDVDASAMAEAMGFSGFGMQRAAKKRKFNPRADASVSGQQVPNASGSGANSAPLGERRLPPPPASLPSRPPAAAAGNAEEIGLDDEDDAGPGADAGDGLGAGPEVEAQGWMGNAVDSGPPGLDARAAGRFRKQQPGGGPRAAGRHGGGGGDGRPWWEGYYDAKMNENPWERLEKQRGLEPRGTWLARESGPNAGTSKT